MFFCKQDQLKSWKADLKENCTYVMHNFKVTKNDGQFRVCDHQYKLIFTGVIVVRQSDLDDLLLGNLNLRIFLMSLLVIFKLASWFVGPPTICAFIFIDKFMGFKMTYLCFLFP